MDVGIDIADVANVLKDEFCEKFQKLFQNFLEEFQVNGDAVYVVAAKELGNPERNTLSVNFEHIEQYSQDLAVCITTDYFRLYPYLCQAVKVFAHDQHDLPLRKDIFISFDNVATRHRVRELTAERIGTLLRISGQVVRAHPVHPELVRGTFTCLECNSVCTGVEQQFKYTQPSKCTNPLCNNRSKFSLDVHKSIFVDFQKVRIQETQAELPRGSIPRSVEVILRAECVEQAQPGDRCDFTGTLIVVPDVSQLAMPGARAESGARHRGAEGFENEGVRGLKALGVRDLTYKLAFLACTVAPTNPRFGGKDFSHEEITVEKLKEYMTPQELKKIFEMASDRALYNNLISSLFPSIYGNDEIKRGILLMLFGGVPKVTREGITLRGDINVCIVGDPSTAKSHCLKQVEEFSPRAVYTSGKASTAAGLTAAVVKDEESSEFVIEAGALMLADNGVCCIDEFDKMDPRDQVAIHEAMEQQTISITKAGVKATLNARTSILAAANPIGGRYDRSRSLRQNINLSAPILSRFDLFFILVDECNEVTDYAIARRIVDLHRRKAQAVDRVYSVEDIQRYVMFARLFKPKLSQEAADCLVTEYKRLRMRDSSGAAWSSWRITVRQLESLVRLSEAMARMHCSDDVQTKHVKEACRLLNKSIIRVEQPDIDLDEEERLLMAAMDEAEAEQEDETMNATDGVETQSSHDVAAAKQAQSKLILTFEEYKHMADLLVLRMRQEEDRKDATSEDPGVRQSDLVAWYLEQIQDEVDSESELVRRKVTVERVIERLVKHDNVLISLSATVEADDHRHEEEDPILVVHPNYVMEDE